jgi:myo-inositol-1(or 4)-monophosphatase
MATVPELLAAAVPTKSSVTDMVSEVDRASERLLVDGILAARPDDGILGEEGTDRAGRSGLRWVIDPLDGTTNFLYGLPGFGVSIAVEGPAGTLVGVVLDPVPRRALRGHRRRRRHPRRRARPLHHGRRPRHRPHRHRLRATGPTSGPSRPRCCGPVLPAVRDIRRLGAAAVDLCAVACGRLDGYYERGLAPVGPRRRRPRRRRGRAPP